MSDLLPEQIFATISNGSLIAKTSVTGYSDAFALTKYVRSDTRPAPKVTPLPWRVKSSTQVQEASAFGVKTFYRVEPNTFDGFVTKGEPKYWTLRHVGETQYVDSGHKFQSSTHAIAYAETHKANLVLSQLDTGGE